LKSRHVSIVSNNDIDDLKVVEDVHITSKTTSIIEDISVAFDILILDEGYTSYEGTSEVVDVIIGSGTPLTIDAQVYDNSDFAFELVEFSVSSQIFRYSFATPLIEDEIDYNTVDSSVITFGGPSESPRADYGFIIVPTKSSSSESSEFLAMIQQVVSYASFTGCLEFIPQSSLPLAGFDVCHPRRPTYLFSQRSFA